MPNIEIHGYDAGNAYGYGKLRAIRDKIWKALEGSSEIGEIVVSDGNTSVAGVHNESMPHLRILWTPETSQAELDDLERRLDTLDMDMEFLPLTKFVERRSVRQKKASNSIGPGFRDPHSGAIV